MIGENLKVLRQHHGYTMEALAEKIGVSRQAVAKWENGDSVPDLINSIALAELYRVTLDSLVQDSPFEVVQRSEDEGKYLFGVVKVEENGHVALPSKALEVFDIHEGDELLIVGDTRKGMALVKLNGTADFFKE